MARLRSILPAALLAAALGGCAEAPVAPPLDPTRAPAPHPDFSGEAAFGHLEQLVAIGPRVSGTEGGESARAYLRGQLEGLGLEVLEQAGEVEVEEGESVSVTNLVAVVPGASTDLVVLAAPYDSQPFDFPFVGANDGASGAALLLELARVLAEHPLPYTTWLAFLDAEAPRVPDQSDAQGFSGTKILVTELATAERMESVRLAVYFNQVADRELTITRDLRSHRRYRNAFFAAARRLGHAEAFPESGPFESPLGGHLGFLSLRMRRVLLITDSRFGGDEPPGTHSHTEQDDLESCSAESLATVGRVSEAALRDITGTLAKIDRFARRPVPPEPETEPAASEEEPQEAPEEMQPTAEAPVEEAGAASDTVPEEAPAEAEAGAGQPEADPQRGAQAPGSEAEAPSENPFEAPPPAADPEGGDEAPPAP